MATPVLISEQEYLDTTYRPDRDFVDGELKDGEPDEPIVHSAPLICIEIRRTYCRCSNFRSLQFEQTVSKMPRVMFTSPLRCPSAPYRRRQRGQRNSPAQ